MTNQILCGDSNAVLTQIADQSVDCVITDPPYLVNYRDRNGCTIANDTNESGVLGVFDELYRVLKPNTYCVSFYGWNAIAAFSRAWEKAGFEIVCSIVWPKSYASSRGHMKYQHEGAYVLAKGRPCKPANPISTVQKWHYTGNKHHPTQKSVEIIKPLVESFCPKSGVVLDPFMGSGTTPVAAAMAERGYIGIELEQRYCGIAKARLERVRAWREWLM